MRSINEGYSHLLVVGAQDEEEQDGEREGRAPQNSSFAEKWGWTHAVDQVSETMRIPWPDVYRLEVIEFLTTLCYIRDKRAWEKSEIGKFKRQN